MSRNGTDDNVRQFRRAARWLLISAVLSAVVIAASLTVAVLVARDAQPASLHAWADVGQAFGALSAVVAAAALVALIFTFAAQQHEMREQRTELQAQNEALARSGRELRCTAETNLAMHHLELLKLSIDHPHLASVWPTWTSHVSWETNQQYRYCNLILDEVWLNYRTERLDYDDVRAAITYLAGSPTIRAYWAEARQARQSAVTADGPESAYFQLVDEVFGA